MTVTDPIAPSEAGRCQSVECPHPTVHRVAERVLHDLQRASYSNQMTNFWGLWVQRPRDVAYDQTLQWFLADRGYLVPHTTVTDRLAGVSVYGPGRECADFLHRSQAIRTAQAHMLAQEYLVYLTVADERAALYHAEGVAQRHMAQGNVRYFDPELWEGKP